MKLHTVDGVFSVADAHDFSIVDGYGGYLKARRDRKFITSQRVVTRRSEGVADAVENAFFVMFYCAGFSMHQLFCRDYFSAESMDYSLVAEADAESGNLAAYLLQDGCANAEVSFVFRGAWTRRNNYPVGFKLLNLLQVYLVVSVDDNFCSEFSDVLDKVVNERIVVVYD